MTDSPQCERAACKALAGDVERYRKGMFQESAHLLEALDEIDRLREELRTARECSCVWKGRTQGPRGWVELIDKRDPTCSVHGDD